MSFDVGFLELLVFVGTVVLSVAWLHSSLAKQRHKELEELAETRGSRIEDLEDQIGRLTTKVQQLEGRFQALQDLKAEQIATVVANKLREEGIVG